MKKTLYIFSMLFFCAGYTIVHAEQLGFPEKSIWYSDDSFTAGETVTIYTLVVNSESSPVSGTVRFYDRDVVLGESKITIDKNDAKVVPLNWKVTEGEHQFSAQFSQVTLTESNGSKVSIVPTSSQTSKDTVYVKKNTEKPQEDTSALAAQASLNKDVITTEVSKATDFIKDKTPDSIEAKVSGATLNIENLRETWEDQFNEKKQSEKDSLKALNAYYDDRLKAKEEADPDNFVKQTYVDSSGENILKKPLHYVLIFLYSLVLFVVGNALIFYGLALLIVFWILRAIWRKIRN